MDHSQVYKIAISLIPGIGSVNAKKLIAHVGSPEGVFKEKKTNLLKIDGVGKFLAESILNNKALHLAEAEIEFVSKYNIKTLFYLDDDYPSRLKHCEDSPVIIYVKGDIDLEASKILSIVGTRNATSYGKERCEALIKELRERKHNILIVSGLAYGVDICAHVSSLKHGFNTAAVLGHGLNSIYPSSHNSYAKKIIEQGALITEFVSNEGPERQNFVKRNRIIAGLADATIVVESGMKGGALITADIANSYNRDVFAFPGRCNDLWSEGCNRLIKVNKAALIENACDLEYMLGWEAEDKNNIEIQKRLFVELEDEEQLVYDIFKAEKEITIDQISLKCKMPISKMSPILLNLEFTGLIKSLPGSVYKII